MTFTFTRLPWYPLLLNDLPTHPVSMKELVKPSQFLPLLGSHNFKCSSFKLSKAERIVLTISEAREKLLNHKHIKREKGLLSAGSP